MCYCVFFFCFAKNVYIQYIQLMFRRGCSLLAVFTKAFNIQFHFKQEACKYCFHLHGNTCSHERISNAGHHPDFSLLLFPSCCPGDQWHVAAGGCWCLPASQWSSRSEDHILTSNKGFVLKTGCLSWLITTLIFIIKSGFLFFSFFLTFFYTITLFVSLTYSSVFLSVAPLCEYDCY